MTSFALLGEVLHGEASCSVHIFQPRGELAALRRNHELLRKPRPLERHWYRSLENPLSTSDRSLAGDLGEQRSVYRDNAKGDRNRRSYKIERESD